MDKWTKPIRTAIQVLIVLIPAVPVLVPALGLSATAGVGAGLVAGAAALSRIMEIPAVEELLKHLKIETKQPE